MGVTVCHCLRLQLDPHTHTHTHTQHTHTHTHTDRTLENPPTCALNRTVRCISTKLPSQSTVTMIMSKHSTPSKSFPCYKRHIERLRAARKLCDLHWFLQDGLKNVMPVGIKQGTSYPQSETLPAFSYNHIYEQ